MVARMRDWLILMAKTTMPWSLVGMIVCSAILLFIDLQSSVAIAVKMLFAASLCLWAIESQARMRKWYLARKETN